MMATEKNTLTGWMWLGALLLMLVEFVIFDRMTSAHYGSIYPRWNDQIQYLSESYTAYEQMQVHGLAAGLKFTLTKTALQGTLHDFSALLVFWLVGAASRSAALSLNMLAFLSWQAALLAFVPRLTGSRALGWMSFGLVLCVAGPWAAGPGSAVDFRLDHGAMCLLGLTSVLALLTDGFRSTRWAVAFGIATGLTMLERFLTGIYFVAIFSFTAIWILCGDLRGPRLRNLCLAGLVTTSLALPVFWINRVAIYNYYWVGHVTGAEGAARLPGMNLWHSIQFVFGYLGQLQLGTYFGWVTALTTAALLLLFGFGPRRPAPGPGRDWLFFSFTFLLLPAAVLCVHPQKSAYVLGVLVPGILLLVLWIWTALWQRIDFPGAVSKLRFVPIMLAAAVLMAGGFHFVRRQLWQPLSPEFLASANVVNEVADRIYTASRQGNLANPNIAVDQVVDFIDAQILQVVCYERHKVWVPFVIQLPNSILAEPDETILYRLKLCDFVLLTEEMPGDGYWPYDKQMRRLYPELRDWCDGHLRTAHLFSVFGRRMRLYQRPELP